jgi:hypothetical protein
LENINYIVEAYRERLSFYDSIGLFQERNRMYEFIFNIYAEVVSDRSVYKNFGREFRLEFKELHKELRSVELSSAFVIYYELFYVFPSFTFKCNNFYQKVKTKIISRSCNK